MNKVVLDTNVLVQLLVGNVEEQQKEAIRLFKRAEKAKMMLIVLPVVLAESCFVLNSYYKKSNEEVATTMEGLLSVDWLEIEHKEAMRGMWGWYREGRHFVDSYLLALQKFENCQITSFDKRLMKKIGI